MNVGKRHKIIIIIECGVNLFVKNNIGNGGGPYNNILYYYITLH